jgi:hypothetical protein
LVGEGKRTAQACFVQKLDSSTSLVITEDAELMVYFDVTGQCV